MKTTEGNPTRLHLGCGEKQLPGFTHVDIRPGVNPDIVADVRKLSMINTNSVREIYFCHGLEHLKYAEVQPALMEWRRVLVPGGVLRLSVPDFYNLMLAYRSFYDSGIGLPLALIRGAISGGQEYPGNIHYSVWDYDTLVEALSQAGYTQIQGYSAWTWLRSLFGGRELKGLYADWSIGRIRGYDISLNVEARA